MKADRFIKAMVKGKPTKAQRVWATQMKARCSIAPTSFLAHCLASLPAHGQPKAPAMAGASVAELRAGTATVPEKIVESGIELTPGIQ